MSSCETIVASDIPALLQLTFRQAQMLQVQKQDFSDGSGGGVEVCVEIDVYGKLRVRSIRKKSAAFLKVTGTTSLA